MAPHLLGHVKAVMLIMTRGFGAKSMQAASLLPASHFLAAFIPTMKSFSGCGGTRPWHPPASLLNAALPPPPDRSARASTRPIPTHKKGPEGVGFFCGGSAAGPKDGGRRAWTPPRGMWVVFSWARGVRALGLKGTDNFDMVFTQRGAWCTTVVG